MTRSKKRIILLSAIVILFITLTTPLTKISTVHLSYNDPLNESEILSVNEINDFMEVWSKFIKEGHYQKMTQISLSNDSQVPTSVISWLELEGWSAQRFFAVEQRLRFLVSVATLENGLEANIKLLKRSRNINISNIVETQKQKLSSLKYSSQELALVKENMYQISAVLDGKGIIE
ncbi:MAG: hypothetical protein E7019_03170 [Alphaproteobacteria bacterium]|nr:hypothetical protein [Alphaproteobacteria bacterium]